MKTNKETTKSVNTSTTKQTTKKSEKQDKNGNLLFNKKIKGQKNLVPYVKTPSGTELSLDDYNAVNRTIDRLKNTPEVATINKSLEKQLVKTTQPKFKKTPPTVSTVNTPPKKQTTKKYYIDGDGTPFLFNTLKTSTNAIQIARPTTKTITTSKKIKEIDKLLLKYEKDKIKADKSKNIPLYREITFELSRLYDERRALYFQLDKEKPKQNINQDFIDTFATKKRKQQSKSKEEQDEIEKQKILSELYPNVNISEIYSSKNENPRQNNDKKFLNFQTLQLEERILIAELTEDKYKLNKDKKIGGSTKTLKLLKDFKAKQKRLEEVRRAIKNSGGFPAEYTLPPTPSDSDSEIDETEDFDKILSKREQTFKNIGRRRVD
jgi:hypothetical protein